MKARHRLLTALWAVGAVTLGAAGGLGATGQSVANAAAFPLVATTAAPIGAAPLAIASPPSIATPSATKPPTSTARPLPAHSGHGRRVVYSRALQHVWVVSATGAVIRQFPVSGRKDWPRTGTFHVFSKSPSSSNPKYKVTFHKMIRFTVGHSAAIGFHTIPRYYAGPKKGQLMQQVSQLGKAVGLGGCPHVSDADAAFLWHWAGLGTTVVVLK